MMTDLHALIHVTLTSTKRDAVDVSLGAFSTNVELERVARPFTRQIQLRDFDLRRLGQMRLKKKKK